MSIAYSRCGHEYEKIFKDKESIEILKILSLINNIEEYQKIYNHVQKGIAQESRLKKIDEIRNYLIEEINQHELISKKHKKSIEFKLYWPLTYCNFYNYCMRFYFCFCFFS